MFLEVRSIDKADRYRVGFLSDLAQVEGFVRSRFDAGDRYLSVRDENGREYGSITSGHSRRVWYASPESRREFASGGAPESCHA